MPSPPVHPPLEPFDSGLLPMPDGTATYWETSGNPAGKPVLYLHGGPGGGLGPGGYRRRADPRRHLIVGVDQRGCGRSTPLISDDLARLPDNTTQALIGDLEAVRAHLGIERWVVTGVSWGSTLALAYAQAHRERVLAIVLAAVTTTGRDEIDWITEGVGRIFPEAWERFAAASGRGPGERVVEAYARRLASTDPADVDDRVRAADDWDAWETTHISLDPLAPPTAPLHGDPTERLVFGTLVTHYWAHDAFLPGPDAILERMDRIAHLPGVLIHGRHDISGPAITPWQLHQRWPASTLHVVEGEGHGGPESMGLLCSATDDLADD